LVTDDNISPTVLSDLQTRGIRVIIAE